MSLVESVARRNPTPSELLETIRAAQKRGDNAAQIREKTAREETCVRGILTLFDKGGRRLINAVEAGRMPLAAALAISKAQRRRAANPAGVL